MIDLSFKHGIPEEIWFTAISPDEPNDVPNLYRILNNVEEVKSITVSKVSRHLIHEHFKNLPMPTTLPKNLFFTGDFAQQIVGQLIMMALEEEPYLMGYFPLKK